MTMMVNPPPEPEVPKPRAVLLSITAFAGVPRPVMPWLVDDAQALVSMYDTLLLKNSDIQELLTAYTEELVAM